MPLRLPDRLPAIDLLKQENIFVMDDTRAHSQDGDRPDPSAVEHTVAAGDQFYEIAEPYAQEYADRTHDDVLS